MAPPGPAAENTGFVSVGIDRDTAQFSVAAITAWWDQLGRQRYPDATSLQMTADCGGSNGNRTRLWKTELQRLADHARLQISVCHFPPGTSKWNKVEHRLFSFISKNWRGRSLASYEVIINSIAATTTRTGLEVYARLDDNEYPKIEITDQQLAAVNRAPALAGDPPHLRRGLPQLRRLPRTRRHPRRPDSGRSAPLSRPPRAGRPLARDRRQAPLSAAWPR